VPAVDALRDLEPERAAELLDPAGVDVPTTAALEELVEERRSAVLPSRTLSVIGQLLDAETDEVTWVGDARARVPATWSKVDVAKELVRRLMTGE
jgi:hypothetical protein